MAEGIGDSFRLWLVDRLSDTKHARRTFASDAARLTYASRIGVQPDVLVAARERLQERLREHGRRPAQGRKSKGSEHPQVELSMPEPVFDAWVDYCDQMKIKGSSLLRSVVEAYLRGDWEPPGARPAWVWKGEIHSVPWRRHPWQEKAHVSIGAYRALARRAQRMGVSRTAILRGLVLEVLEGRIKGLRPVAASSMWNDVDRYFAAADLDRPKGGGDEP